MNFRNRAGLLLPAACAFAAGGIGLAALRDGIGLSSDGWVYWQGSVSLIRGLGYRLFYQNRPIASWPPLFSIYLGLFQAALGVSGRALVAAMVVAAASAGFLWTRLLIVVARRTARIPQELNLWRLIPGCIFVAAFLGTRFRLLLADDLALVLLPLALLSAIRLDEPSSRVSTAARLAALSFWLFLCLACKNSALAWVAGAGVLVVGFGWARRARLRALARGIVVTAATLAGWLALRAALGQAGSHPVVGGRGAYSPFEYALQGIESLGGMIGPRRFLLLGPLLAMALLAGILLSIFSLRRARPEASRLLGWLLVFTGTALAATGALLGLTGLPDELSDRFVWFAALMLVGLATASWSASRFPKTFDRVLGSTLLAIAGLAVFYAARSYRTPPATPNAEGTFVRLNWTIEPGFVERRPQPRGRLLLVSPPVPDWERQ